ncbi:helix-turn-helix domain-containing protein [Flavobacterium sp.]|uniref:helix-turn-helix domain-containing protein n=1 Tax=Flavobacterium sp. TaxID=239 RepID=UPI0025C491E3|nr:helix-turn-helix domain-containing protein [Flavobacterium sp.]
MKELKYCNGLSSLWYKELAAKLEVTLENDKILVLPDTIGKGYSFFVEVIPGMSALLLDFVLSAPVRVQHLANKDDLYIINFDLSEEVNMIQIRDISYQVGSKVNLGLFVWKNTIGNTCEHLAGKRIFTIRLIVDQKLLHPLFIKTTDQNLSSKNNDRFDRKDLYFQDLIDSNSRILIDSVMRKTVLDEHFNFYLKGLALKLLGNFIHRYSDVVPLSQGIKKIDLEALDISKKFLVKNLKNKFPGILKLSEIASMSASKYKRLFKEIEGVTPNDFFKREKIVLAHKLLCSGSYNSVVQLGYDLNFTRIDHFSKEYFKFLGRSPAEDLVVKNKPE